MPTHLIEPDWELEAWGREAWREQDFRKFSIAHMFYKTYQEWVDAGSPRFYL